MQKKGYSGSCASCMAQLVGCSRDHCMNQCISAEGEHVEDCRISSATARPRKTRARVICMCERCQLYAKCLYANDAGITNDKSRACTHCVKSSCRPKMKACSGLAVGGH